MENQKIHSLYQKLLEASTCPISHCIMNEVVIADDGHFYEKTAIEKWLSEKDTSPMTNNVINKKNIIPAHNFRSLINYLLEIYPSLKADQYIPSKPNHSEHVTKVNGHITNKKYHELLKFQNFIFTKFIGHHGSGEIKLQILLKNAPIDILKYIIDNMENLEKKAYNKSKLIHYVCESGRRELVIYLVDKNVSLEDNNEYNKKPIHYACKHCDFEAIQYLIDKNVKLDSRDIYKNYPFHFLIDNNRLSTKQKITLFDKCPNLNYSNKKGTYPIHMACSMGDEELVNYFINHKDINLECENTAHWRPIHYVCANALYSCLNNLIKKGVNIECKTDKGMKPIHLATQVTALTMVKYLIDAGASVENYTNGEIEGEDENLEVESLEHESDSEDEDNE